jgi:hypothetical protein
MYFLNGNIEFCSFAFRKNLRDFVLIVSTSKISFCFFPKKLKTAAWPIPDPTLVFYMQFVIGK